MKAQPRTVPGESELVSDRGDSELVATAPLEQRNSVLAATRSSSDEETIASLHARIESLEAALAAAEEALASSERSQALERAAVSAGASDVETVAVLAALAIDSGSSGGVEEAVSELRESKPHLFSLGGRVRVSPVRSASVEREGPESAAVVAAREAVSSGDRSALMRYLRLRRSSL